MSSLRSIFKCVDGSTCCIRFEIKRTFSSANNKQFVYHGDNHLKWRWIPLQLSWRFGMRNELKCEHESQWHLFYAIMIASASRTGEFSLEYSVHSFPLAFSMRAHQTPHTHFGANAFFELNEIVLHNSLSTLFAQKVMPFIFKSHTVFVRLSFIRLASSRRSFVWRNLRSTITY